MGSPLCGGSFQNRFYRFNNDAEIYQYNSTTSVAKLSSAFISNGDDSVTSIKKCIYNGANTIYFIGTTNEDPDTILYSAVFNNASHNFVFQKLPDPTNGSLDVDNTTIVAVDHWSDLSGCVMLGYDTNSFGVACPQKAAIKVTSNKNYGISTTKNIFTTQDSQLYQLTTEGLKGFSIIIDDKLSSIAISNLSSTVYKFQEPNTIDPNANWNISTSEDSTQALFYSLGPSFQLLKLDKETRTAKIVNNSFNNISLDSVALFQNSSIFVLNKVSYQKVSIDQVAPTAGIDNNVTTSVSASEPTLINADGISKGSNIDPAVAGGFTALGIVIGALLAALLFYILSRCRREKEITSPRGITPSFIDCAHVEEIIPHQIGTIKPADITPVIYTQNVARRPSFRAQLIPSNIGEGDPKNAKYPSIFNNRCNVNPSIIGVVSTNPQHQSSVYVRECTFQDRPALIHYFNSNEGERKFENALQVLNSPLLKSNGGHIVEFLDAIQLKTTTSADKGFKFILITSFYEPGQNLTGLYQSASTGETVVDVLDETFIAYTIYSLLLAIRDLHAAGYVHRCLSADSFYAESNAPTTDWILADFDEAGLASATYVIPPGKYEYYDALYNGKTFEFESDIWALGLLLFKVISGGHDIKMDTTTNYSDHIEQQVQGRIYSEQYRMLLKSTLCNKPHETRLTAKQLVEYWENRFDFGQAD